MRDDALERNPHCEVDRSFKVFPLVDSRFQDLDFLKIKGRHIDRYRLLKYSEIDNYTTGTDQVAHL
jgi:hypothetical protein